VARIRSIKPDFFTSEAIASLSLSARLTFIGLWTYVDDNGVGQYNEMLINAAVWPLEEDSLETLTRTRGDIAELRGADLVVLFRDARKRYVFITSWDEHQKVDHPRKPRYPRPGADGCEALPADPREDLASDSRESREIPANSPPQSLETDPRENLASDSRDLREGAVDQSLKAVPTCEDDEFASDSREPREDLAPEQGAGSREQGSKELGRQAGRSPAPAPAPAPGSDDDADFAAFWDAYPRKVAKGTARKAWRAAVRKVGPKEIIRAAERYAADPVRKAGTAEFTAHPATWLNGERWLDYDGRPATPRTQSFPWEN
jgi:hypothetical protein